MNTTILEDEKRDEHEKEETEEDEVSSDGRKNKIGEGGAGRVDIIAFGCKRIHCTRWTKRIEQQQQHSHG